MRLPFPKGWGWWDPTARQRSAVLAGPGLCMCQRGSSPPWVQLSRGCGSLRWLLPSGSPDQHPNPPSAARAGFPGGRRAHVQGPRTSHQACNSLMPKIRSRLTCRGTASTQHPAAAGPVRVPRPPSVPTPCQIQEGFYLPNLPTQCLSSPADLAARGSSGTFLLLLLVEALCHNPAIFNALCFIKDLFKSFFFEGLLKNEKT